MKTTISLEYFSKESVMLKYTKMYFQCAII